MSSFYKIKILLSLVFVIPVYFISCDSNSKKSPIAKVDVVFQEDSLNFTETQKVFIREVISNSEKEVRSLLPKLPDSIKIIVEAVD
tara:strand:+ start:1043 stop:1300 length:258 start_codon:yes stop_codon:yes gene_type:complete